MKFSSSLLWGIIATLWVLAVVGLAPLDAVGAVELF